MFDDFVKSFSVLFENLKKIKETKGIIITFFVSLITLIPSGYFILISMKPEINRYLDNKKEVSELKYRIEKEKIENEKIYKENFYLTNKLHKTQDNLKESEKK